jgi:hypothetical protein
MPAQTRLFDHDDMASRPQADAAPHFLRRRPVNFVSQCHIVEHEDNEMMRPYRIGQATPTSVQTCGRRLRPHASGEPD